jgi:hypothetical protein
VGGWGGAIPWAWVLHLAPRFTEQGGECPGTLAWVARELPAAARPRLAGVPARMGLLDTTASKDRGPVAEAALPARREEMGVVVVVGILIVGYKPHIHE